VTKLMDGHSKQAGVVPGNAACFRPCLVRIKMGITASASSREESVGKDCARAIKRISVTVVVSVEEHLYIRLVVVPGLGE